MSKRQLHISGLNLLSKCGIAFERRYINQERTPTSVSAAIGAAVDRSASRNLRHKIEAQELLPEEEVNEIARDTLVNIWAEVENTPGDKDDGVEFSRDKALDRSVALAGFHHRKLAPQMRVTHVQREWTLDISGLDLQLAGTIDFQEGSYSIDDLKTSAKSPARDIADKSLQLTTYALAVKTHDKVMPQRVRLDYLVMTPHKSALKLVQLESRRTVESFTPLLKRIAAANKSIETGIFTPAPADSWWCSAKFCPFYRTCPYAVRPISISFS